MRDRTGGSGRAVIMSYDPGTAVLKGPSWGQTLEDFYRIHNLDEKRRKYLEDLKRQLSIIS
jgi:hypothetical protein